MQCHEDCLVDQARKVMVDLKKHKNGGKNFKKIKKGNERKFCLFLNFVFSKCISGVLMFIEVDKEDVSHYFLKDVYHSL